MANYKALVKLRKQQLEQAEQDLISANALILKLEQKKAKLEQQASNITIPTTGKGSQLIAFMTQKEVIKKEIEICKTQIEAAKRAKNEKEIALRKLNIVYGQAKAIEAHYVKQKLSKEKRNIQNSLDEIASQRFWRDRVGLRVNNGGF